MSSKQNVFISVVGPTAVGKTSFAIELAKHFSTEIISVDSRQFYQEMEIGTAKPSSEELNTIRHHFINSHQISQYYSAGKFEVDALELLESLFKQHDNVIGVGGSGLYFKALWEGMDEMPKISMEIREQLNQELEVGGLNPLLAELASSDPDYFHQVDRNNHQRVIRGLEVIRSTGKAFSSFRKGHKPRSRNFRNVKIGLELDRNVLYERINDRMDQMIEKGLFEEAENLFTDRHLNALQTVGYKEIFGFLLGEYPKEEAIRLLKRNSRRYAKRQLTWFKRDPEIHWMHPDDLEKGIKFVQSNT